MSNYQVELYAQIYGVKKVLIKYSKEGITFEDLKVSILKRLGNIDYFENDKKTAKQLIYNSKTTDELVESIYLETRFELRIIESEK
ncbi:hypothetical protein FG335_14385 [Listeria monocytogenes]|nr:hypothetical protein [Listeria monocytogenes]